MANVSNSSPLSSGDATLDDLRIVGLAGSAPADGKGLPDDQLLDLFWKRADLKKRFSKLRDELADARDALKKKDADIDRVRQQKRALEQALGDTQSAFPALAYYHLRGLWNAANAHMCGFRDELIEQQRDRERKRQIMEFNQKREARLASLGEEISAAKTDADNKRDAVQHYEAELESLGGLFRYFARKRLEPELEASRAVYDAARAALESLFDQRIKLESMPWPDKSDLSCEGKRVINLAVIALAQHLYLHFSDNGLGALARTTTLKSLGDIEFGTREDCEFLIHRVSSAVAAMRNDRSFAEPLRERAKYLRSIARFKQDTDAVPSADSIGQVMPSVPGVEIGNTVAGVPLDVNVVIEDYWNVASVLLR